MQSKIHCIQIINKMAMARMLLTKRVSLTKAKQVTTTNICFIFKMSQKIFCCIGFRVQILPRPNITVPVMYWVSVTDQAPARVCAIEVSLAYQAQGLPSISSITRFSVLMLPTQTFWVVSPFWGSGLLSRMKSCVVRRDVYGGR